MYFTVYVIFLSKKIPQNMVILDNFRATHDDLCNSKGFNPLIRIRHLQTPINYIYETIKSRIFLKKGFVFYMIKIYI